MLSYIFKHFIKITIITNECKAVYSGCCCADLVVTAEGSRFFRTWFFIRFFFYFLLQRLCRSSYSSPHLRCLCAGLFGFWRTKICFSSFFGGAEVEQGWTFIYVFLCPDCSWWSLGQNPSWTTPACLNMRNNNSHDKLGKEGRWQILLSQSKLSIHPHPGPDPIIMFDSWGWCSCELQEQIWQAISR